MSSKYCSIRSEPRRFGISFTVPDRVAAEINDKKRVAGKHPLRLTRIPSGGPGEFHQLVEEAKKESSALGWKKRNGVVKKMNKKAYHRSRFNDWYVQVFYLESCSDQIQSLLPSESDFHE